MARSKQTSQKSEKEKNKKRKQKEKEEKKALRKAGSNKGKGFDSMIAYVDHNGQLTDIPPDPKLKVEVKAEDILIGAVSFSKKEQNTSYSGRIAIYNEEKRYGFIKESISQEKIFFHVSNTDGPVQEGDLVTYETVHGPKGWSAVNVKKKSWYMNWRNAFMDDLPKDTEEVFISVNGINYMATYNKSEKGFHIRDTKKFIRISPANSTIYWTEIIGHDG